MSETLTIHVNGEPREIPKGLNVTQLVALLGLTANRLAMELLVAVTRVNDIVRGKRAITADTALRLARFFGTTPQFWMNLQANYELELAEDARGAEIASRIRPHRAA